MFNWIFKMLLNKAKDYILKNWKTTVVGLLGAALTQVPALAPHKETIVTAIIALLGIVAKDGDTSGTTEQPREAAKVSAALKVEPVADPGFNP